MFALLNLGPIHSRQCPLGSILAAIVPTLTNCGPIPFPIVPTLLKFGSNPHSDNERYAEIVPTSTIVRSNCGPNPPSDSERYAEIAPTWAIVSVFRSHV